MSISFHVFTRSDRLPSMAQWAQALHACGIPASPDANADLQRFSGYLPCPDERVGFELYVEPYSSAHLEFGPDAPNVVGDTDFVLTFRLSGRAADLDAAMLAAASLASLSDGILFDSQSRHYIAASSAMDWARRQAYHPLAVYRARAQRRRSRHRIATLLRLLLLLIVVAAFLLLYRT